MEDRAKMHLREESSSQHSASSSGMIADFEMKMYVPPPNQLVPHPTRGTGTDPYVIRIPKDQIYKTTQKNEEKVRSLTVQSERRISHHLRSCWLILYTVIFFAFLALILFTIAVPIFYLIVYPQTPNYSIVSLCFSGFDLTSFIIAPQIYVVLTANNPNKRVSIDYRSGGYIAAYHNNLMLCDGPLPAFHQPKQNVTLIETKLGESSSGMMLGNEVSVEMERQMCAGSVPLKLSIKSPIRMKVGDVLTWKTTVKLTCNIVVDKLAPGAMILYNSCDSGV